MRFLISMFFLMATSVALASPLDDAIAVWNFNDIHDANGADSVLEVVGEVEMNVPLSGQDAEESLARGGDTRVARFQNGYLSANQGADGELNVTGSEITIYIRVRMEEIPVSFPIFSKHGGHTNMGYNLFAFEDYIGTEIGTTGNLVSRDSEVRAPISCKAKFAEMLDPDTAAARWHDVVVRVNEAKLEMFVDGRCVDEDFVLGELNSNDVPLLFGAQKTGKDSGIASGFQGEMDTAAVWARSLSDDEIQTLCGGPARVDDRQRTDRGNGESLQYWCPPNEYGVGDCMPFSHDGLFHVVYLLDKKRHTAKNGYGAHQWIQATSLDLKHWEHQPFVVPITRQDEGSICTGSVFYHDGTFYALYANRKVGVGGQLAYSTSTDGIHFSKAVEPLIQMSAGYSGSLRDPVAFTTDDGLIHLYATTSYRGRGCWAHLVSPDMKTWELRDPIYLQGASEPECPDWFQWGDFFYTIAGYGSGLYRLSDNADGPWRVPTQPSRLMSGIVRVPKTAPFGENRRIIVGWTGQRGFGGDMVFHELIQYPNGDLGEKFVPEMIPATGEVCISSKNLQATAKRWENLPGEFRLQAVVTFDPARVNNLLDYVFKISDEMEIRLIPTENAVCVGTFRLENVDFTAGRVTLDVILKRDLIDVCVNDCRTVTVTLPKADVRTLEVQDFSQVLTGPVTLSPTDRLPEETLPTKLGFVLESLKINSLR